jgi:hypothetical protein
MEPAYQHANFHLAVAIAMTSSVEFPGVAAVTFCRYRGRGWSDGDSIKENKIHR